ncbi:hypothetical protein ASV53_20905, partial [Photobacterium sanguinicancri]
MKKITEKQRERDVRRSLFHRSQRKLPASDLVIEFNEPEWLRVNKWVDEEKDLGLNVRHASSKNRRGLVITLPEIMNFSSHFDVTVQHLNAIRKLTTNKSFFGDGNMPKKAYKLAKVNFDNLKEISTSSALVLTAEISRWDDSIRRNLTPQVDGCLLYTS